MLTVHPITRKTLDRLTHEVPQSLLLSGEIGVGLMTVAEELAGASVAGHIRPQDIKGQRDDTNGTISVEMIRRLYEQTRAKYTTRQTIIIDNADRMSRGAGSAFLKLLEEPNEYIYFILTSHQPQQLLPTIRSRLQHTRIRPITSEQTTELIKLLGVTESVRQTQLQFIATGLPAELTRLARNEAYFAKQAEAIGDARDFLQGDIYKKILVIQKYKANRAGALQLCESALHMLRRTLSTNPQPALVTQLDRLLSVQERIGANHNIPLQLMQFVL